MVYLHNRGRKGTAMKFREARAGTKTDTNHPQAGQLCSCGKSTVRQLDTRGLCYLSIRCGDCGYTSSIDRAAAWADAKAAWAAAKAAWAAAWATSDAAWADAWADARATLPPPPAAAARAAWADARAAWADARAAWWRGQ